MTSHMLSREAFKNFKQKIEQRYIDDETRPSLNKLIEDFDEKNIPPNNFFKIFVF